MDDVCLAGSWHEVASALQRLSSPGRPPPQPSQVHPYYLCWLLSILWTWLPFLPASSSTPLVNSPSLVHPSALPPSASHSLPPSVSRQPSRSSNRSPSCLTLKLACCSSGIVLLGASSAFPLGSPRPPPSPKPRPTSTMRSATASSPCALAPCHQMPGCKPPCLLLLVVLVSATLPDTAGPSSTRTSFAMLWTSTTSPTTATLSSQPPRMCSPLTVCLRLCRPPSDSNSCPQALDKATVEHLARSAPGREAFRAHLKLLQQPGAGACCTLHHLKLLASMSLLLCSLSWSRCGSGFLSVTKTCPAHFATVYWTDTATGGDRTKRHHRLRSIVAARAHAAGLNHEIEKSWPSPTSAR